MSLAAKISRKIRSLLRSKRFSLRNPWSSKPLSENEIRFYPASIAFHPNEPKTNHFTIVYHPEYGQGVQTKVHFGKGDLVCRFDGETLSHQTLFTLQKKPGEYIQDPYFTGKILHSCDPNMSVDMEKQMFWACKEIIPGDFLTMDYESTEDRLFRSFRCQCGSARCRGVIAGRLSH